ncbi:MAG: hypothetical protein PHI73_00575 [Patescibacteria group bacterium]|nr:hypothetical protein [Patescibacteria group bacterium]
MPKWMFFVQNVDGSSLGTFQQTLPETPRVGDSFSVDWDSRGGRLIKGRYQYTSVNDHCHQAVIKLVTPAS